MTPIRRLDTGAIWTRLRLTGVRSGDSGDPLEPLQSKACKVFQKTTIREDFKVPIAERLTPSPDIGHRLGHPFATSVTCDHEDGSLNT
jgi:hypothetical protein